MALVLTKPARGEAAKEAPGTKLAPGAPLVPDETLLEQFRRGEPGAFRSLVGRYAGEILSYATRLVGDRAWAEDLTQEVFVKLSQRPPATLANGLRPWLYAVAKNQCLDFLKRRLIAVRACESIALEERVAKTLGALPEEQREAFVLCVLQGLSYEDAAVVAGCSVKTLSSRLARARERFRIKLLGEGRRA